MCEKQYVNRKNGEILDLGKLKELPNNSLLKNRPDIWEFWDFEKNNELGYLIWDIPVSSNKKRYYICNSCKNSSMKIFRKNVLDSECNNCKLFKNKYPELYKEVHPSKNEGIKIEELTYGMHLNVWWLGGCGHEWDAPIKRRTIGKEGCPICSSNRVLIGYNDIWTTRPDIASQMLNRNDGYLYMENSNKYVDWKCAKCETNLSHQKISKVSNYGLTCHYCSDGFSFPTKVFASILKQSNITFKTEKTFKWSGRSRYDFYFEIKGESYIVELHGMQHYGRGFTLDNRYDLAKRKEIDKTKERLAFENGIDNYIVIDCRHSELEWIRNNLMDSELSRILNFSSMDWRKVLLEANNSYMMETLRYWNEGIKSTKKIADKIGINRQTTLKYLKILAKDGLCDYKVENKKGVI